MDARPNDHDKPGLSRRMPCRLCDHDEHVLHCGALIYPYNVPCPCRDIGVPGVYP